MRSAVSSSSKSAKSECSSFLSKALKSPSTAAILVEAEPEEAQALKRLPRLSFVTGEGPTANGGTGTGETARVVYLTEQVSHHRPRLRVLHCMPPKVLRAFRHRPDIGQSLRDDVARFSWSV